jgi:hypothetical protein
MKTLVDNTVFAIYQNGQIHVRMGKCVEIMFPVKKNFRLSRGTDQQLNNIEISPYGLHWPDLDEDLSFKGLLEDDFGQYVKFRKKDK